MSKIRVGVIGLGMMGLTHLDVYSKMEDVEIVAISDMNPARLSGQEKASGNIEGQAQGGLDYSTMHTYTEGMDLIADPEVDLVDVCLPAMLHVDYALAAMASGKHLFLEKPVARTYEGCLKILEAQKKAVGFAMPGMCIRFWPGWSWLKQVISDGTYGKVCSAQFCRLSEHPGGFYLNGEATGGAALDLHIHDVDFVNYLFGMPKSVFSAGYRKLTTHIDHIFTTYEYDHIPLVTTEGGWCMSKGFPFRMEYLVNFENATASLNGNGLFLTYDGKTEQIPLENKMGYELELHYFIECVKNGTPPTVVTLEDASRSIRLAEAECLSADTHKIVEL